MVNPARTALASLLLVMTSAAGVAGVERGEPPERVGLTVGGDRRGESRAPVRSALEKGRYPWYDAGNDSVKPVWPPREWNLDWLDRWLRRWLPGRGVGRLASAGDLIAIGLAMLGLAILLVVLVELWRRYRPWADDLIGSTRGPLGASRIEGLPAGLHSGTDDPWGEAVRCRAQGDYARAVICLFAYELLTLDRLRHVRLVPGRTGRQLVRAITDREFRAWVEPTLRLFETVYYGHRIPSASMFEPVWASAEAFRRRVAGGEAS